MGTTDGMAYIKIYKDFLVIADELDNNQLGRVFRALLQYANGLEPDSQMSGAEKIAYVTVKSQIDRDLNAYSSNAEKNRENGRKGGRPKKAEGFDENPNNPIGFSKNPNNPVGFSKTQNNRTVFSKTEKSQDKDKDEDKDKEENQKEKGLSNYITESLGELEAADNRELQNFLRSMDEELVCEAVQKGSGKSWAYVRAILKRWAKCGYRTVEDMQSGEGTGANAQERTRQQEAEAENPLLHAKWY